MGIFKKIIISSSDKKIIISFLKRCHKQITDNYFAIPHLQVNKNFPGNTI